jgi:hypothetical protein
MNTQIKHADRLVYLLLVGLGCVARQKFPPAAWCSTNRQRECSDFTIGQRMLQKLQVEPPQALATSSPASSKRHQTGDESGGK